MIIELLINATAGALCVMAGFRLGLRQARQIRQLPASPQCSSPVEPGYYNRDGRCSARADPRRQGNNCTAHCQEHCKGTCLKDIT